MINKVLFRCDGDSTTGLGHLYRCFGIAQMLEPYFEINFVISSKSEDIFSDNFSVTRLDKGILGKAEIKCLQELIIDDETVIILDGYHFDTTYQLLLKNSGFKSLLIDDFASGVYHVNAIVNHAPNLNVNKVEGLDTNKIHHGLAYTMLRNGFLKESSSFNRDVTSLDHLLICFGGADFNNLSKTCLIGALKLDNLKSITVILGRSYNQDWKEELEHLSDERVQLLSNLSENQMIEVMKKSSLAILPTSTVCYEALSIKLPVLGGFYIDNQENIYQGFVSENLVIPAGDFREYNSEDYFNRLSEVSDNYFSLTNAIAPKINSLFDGKQPERFVEIINEL